MQFHVYLLQWEVIDYIVSFEWSANTFLRFQHGEFIIRYIWS